MGDRQEGLVYFPSGDELRWVQRGLLPDARRQPVADELRGWNWERPPLKPVYDQPLGVYEIAGKYCPTGRDVYLRRVTGVQGPPNVGMREGRVLHGVVADVLTQAKRLIYMHGAASLPFLDELSSSSRDDGAALVEPTFELDQLSAKVRTLRRFEARRIVERVEGVLARQPHVQPDALALLALPVGVEVKLDGRFLGLSEHLAADAVSLPDMGVLDLKFGPREAFHRLTTTGYALVLESLYERPVDLGCVVYARFVQSRMVIERDYHVIGDELRQWFIEERDEKARLVAEEIDPGLPGVCPRTCPYLRTCYPTERDLAEPHRIVGVANLPQKASEATVTVPS